MFTGIIKDVGEVAAISAHGRDRRIDFRSNSLDFSDLPLGASIAINGVCLTAVELSAQQFAADVSHETLAVTTFGELRVGDPINLEPSLRLGDSLDGHWLSGHVDGIGQVRSVEAVGRSRVYSIELSAALSRYVAKKGSIAVDGCSLTVNEVDGDCFSITIIPHTLEATIIQHYEVGRAVNIEVDIVARYVERLAAPTR